MKVKVNKVTIQVIQDDILSLGVNAFVNSTDPNLHIDPVLLLKAGLILQEACNDIGWCDIGDAVITDAGNLSYDKIIHVVGPRWGEGSERGKLANATLACLRLAEQHRLRSLAFPAISAGVLGYPLENCARTMITQIIDFTFENPRFLKVVVLCLDNTTAFTIFKNELQDQIEDLKKAGDGEVSV
ncbi:MAG: macro domain-containing protein [Chloroflexi bacterium]|nr:macro domain-containing protein [Chloroflexota bacterium]MCC6891279.1 macro domain-containing protein [Anaerolineae bacterium]